MKYRKKAEDLVLKIKSQKFTNKSFLLVFFINKNWIEFMDIEMLASRSGETVELKSVVVFVIHYCYPYLICGIYICPFCALLLSFSTNEWDAATYWIYLKLSRETNMVLTSIGVFLFSVLVLVGNKRYSDGSIFRRQRAQ